MIKNFSKTKSKSGIAKISPNISRINISKPSHIFNAFSKLVWHIYNESNSLIKTRIAQKSQIKSNLKCLLSNFKKIKDGLHVFSHQDIDLIYTY
ncbi:hypothetical protein BpHYR1_052985 [Brachionus plicatilis]|uniref:Uncharacterized protein n=1 Tax=Brachionus plicatilis TaxID=10195 RepID=A0A3M7RNF6_BRAPC|nr:hypothetical protein BpHYR1_052985 [Brachionus plicatilis]